MRRRNRIDGWRGERGGRGLGGRLGERDEEKGV